MLTKHGDANVPAPYGLEQPSSLLCQQLMAFTSTARLQAWAHAQPQLM